MIITTRKRGNDNCQKIGYKFSHQSISVIRVILFKLLFFIIFNPFFAFLEFRKASSCVGNLII